jgi:hypothetical protein
MTSIDDKTEEAIALLENGQKEEAIEAFKDILNEDPNSIACHVNLANIYIGDQYMLLALPHVQKITRLCPKEISNHLLYVRILGMTNQHKEAERHLKMIAHLYPLDFSVQYQRGIYAWNQGDLTTAIIHLEKAHDLEPTDQECLKYLAKSYLYNQDPENAVTPYKKLLELTPDDAETHFLFALLLLSLGRIKEGWEHYVWRHKYATPHFARFRNQYKAWSGEPVAGKTLLLTWEQGIGDTIQFSRFAPILNAMGANVILDVQPLLLELMSSLPKRDQKSLIIHDTHTPQPQADYLISIMDIPLICASADIETPAISCPYLKAPSDLKDYFSQLTEHLTGFKIGIAWQGSPNYPRDASRSFPLKCFEPIAQIDGIDLVSLQAIHGTDQIADFAHPILDLEKDILEGERGLSRLAAAIENVDMVMCCDSAIAHLAGALNKKVMMFIPSVPDWRWKWHGSSTPYYPSMTIVRQPQHMKWSDVFKKIVPTIKTLVNS